MGGAAGVGAGLSIMGGTLGGIGDIIAAENYKRPQLPEATGREKRLRDLAQSQLLAGGQQTLGGTALYNQLAPILMGQLPGMRYVPGTPGAGGGETGGGESGLGSYQEALSNLQQTQAKQQQLTALKAQIKGAKKTRAQAKGPKKKGMRQDIKGLRQQRRALTAEIAGMPTTAERERQTYLAGVQMSPELYDVRQGTGGADMAGASLGAIRGMMDAENDTGPNLQDLYQGGGGY